jgi:outer membrane protein TolC
MHRRALILCIFVAMSAVGADLPTLPELESKLVSSEALQLMDARYALARERVSIEEHRQGASFYSNSSFSDNNEVVDVGRTRSYRQLGTSVGIRVPILGSRLQWQASLADSALAVAREEGERELKRRQLLKQLREAYATYWAAQEVATLSAAYAADEPTVERGLLLRTKAGLLLDSDRLEFTSGFALAQRDRISAENERQRALDSMRLLINAELDGGTAKRPNSSTCAPNAQAIATWAEAHPDVKFSKAALSQLDSDPRVDPWFPVNAEIRAGYQRSTEWPSQEPGGSAAVTLSFDVPLNFMSQHRVLQSSAATSRSQASLAYEVRRAEVEQAIRNLLRQRAVLDQSLQFARLRLAAGDESVRERELRASSLAGDVMEQLQQSRLARYRAAKELVDAELSLALWSAEWSLYAPSVCTARAQYVWSSESTLDQLRSSRPASLADVNALLISLNAQQLAHYRARPDELNSALMGAHALGFRVQLLLGEPTWMLPEHRSELLGIVDEFASFAFDGIHLDLEPNQLEHLDQAEALRALVATLKAVRTHTVLPIDVSLHPRLLTAEIDGHSLGDELVDNDICATVMIYVANADRVIEIARPLLQRYPRLQQRIALSLEDTLTREESLYEVAPQERKRRFEAIESALQAENFGGITLQPTASKRAAITARTRP